MTGFRHFESRTGDPQLHDHLVVANKVKGSDGKRRTVDSKLLHREAVASSEFYNATIISEMCERLGVSSVVGELSSGTRSVMEIAGIGTDLIDQHSSRSATIRPEVERLTTQDIQDHGREPDLKAQIRIAQQATPETRPSRDHARSPQATRQAAQARIDPERAAALLPAARAIAGGSRMVGLAPSAPAAAALGKAVGIDAATIHGFITAHQHEDIHAKYVIRAGDVIVVDEAGMAGTQRLADILAIARANGAHVRLIGDDRQLFAVEAGGAYMNKGV